MHSLVQILTVLYWVHLIFIPYMYMSNEDRVYHGKPRRWQCYVYSWPATLFYQIWWQVEHSGQGVTSFWGTDSYVFLAWGLIITGGSTLAIRKYRQLKMNHTTTHNERKVAHALFFPCIL